MEEIKHLTPGWDDLKSPSPSGNQTRQWSLQRYGGLWLGSSTFPFSMDFPRRRLNQRLILQQRNTFFDIPEDDADLPEGPATCPPASDGWWPSSSSRPSSVPWTSQWKFNGEGKNVSWKLRRKPKKNMNYSGLEDDSSFGLPSSASICVFLGVTGFAQ